MADFESAFQHVIKNEGGYVNDPKDPGGETYKGVARNIHSKWLGWTLIDMEKSKKDFPKCLDSNLELSGEIKHFYKINYWDKVRADEITNQEVAFSIFDFGVNAGIATSATLAQKVIGAKTDGVIGQQSIESINNYDAEKFLSAFTIAKIARYINIVKKRPTSQKYFYGWVRRALGDN